MVNDEILNEFYRLEFDRIPTLFRFSKTKSKVTLGTILGLIILDIITISLIPHTIDRPVVILGEAAIEKAWIPGGLVPLIIVAVIISLGILILALWLVISIQFEKKAFKKASKMAREKEEWDRMQTKKELSEFRKNNNFY